VAKIHDSINQAIVNSTYSQNNGDNDKNVNTSNNNYNEGSNNNNFNNNGISDNDSDINVNNRIPTNIISNNANTNPRYVRICAFVRICTNMCVFVQICVNLYLCMMYITYKCMQKYI
jgi:hypothetical protein